MRWTAPLLLATVVLAAVPAGAQVRGPVQQRGDRLIVEVGDSPTLGPENAPVTIVEFADFECPFCARGARTMRRLLAMYPTQVRWVFKHFPLSNHAAAPAAHEAALAANEQHRFWEMHEVLFMNQLRLGRPDLDRYAERVGLDLGAFAAALDTRRERSRVLKDIVLARYLGVNATPTYFLNGRRLVGARELEEFKIFVERELQIERETRGAEPAMPAGAAR